VVAACVLVFASVPFRLDTPRGRLPESQDGFGPWQTDEDGKPFRETAEYSSLFVGPGVTALTIRLRRVPGLKGHRLAVDLEPTKATHQTLVTDSWSSVVVSFAGADPPAAYRRVNLWMVHGDRSPANSRASGVAVGDVNCTAIRD
jgi:hypothetical protein